MGQFILQFKRPYQCKTKSIVPEQGIMSLENNPDFCVFEKNKSEDTPKQSDIYNLKGRSI